MVRGLGSNRNQVLESTQFQIDSLLTICVLPAMGLSTLKPQVSTSASRQQIIMHFSTPPSLDDMAGMATAHLESLPEELLEKCNDIQIRIEEFPDTAIEQEMELSDPYDLLCLFKSGSELSPGVMRKTSDADDVLILYRRPILDMWCEAGEDLNHLIRQVMIGELGTCFEFSEEDIDEMVSRHYQGMF